MSASSSTTFTYLAPTSVITSPIGAWPTSPPSIDGTYTGTPSDIEIPLQDTDTSLWWDGAIWGATQVWISVTSFSSNTWTKTLPTLPTGNYEAFSRARECPDDLHTHKTPL